MDSRGCGSGWCYTYDIKNGSMYNNTTVKCNGVVPIQNFTQCPYNGKPCLYNIKDDPCEYNDLSMENPNKLNELYQRLLYYNSTMVPALYALNPAQPNQANPDNFDQFWSSWHNSSYQNQIIYT